MTAKEHYLKQPIVTKVAELVASEPMQTALKYALLVMAENQDDASDVSKGWDAHSRLAGARELVRTLETLHNPVTEPKPRKTPTLSYQ